MHLPRRFFLGSWHQSGFLAENRPTRTLREILTRLRETYCGTIGYEVWGQKEWEDEALRRRRSRWKRDG